MDDSKEIEKESVAVVDIATFHCNGITLSLSVTQQGTWQITRKFTFSGAGYPISTFVNKEDACHMLKEYVAHEILKLAKEED